MTLDQHEPFASLRELHYAHYSRPYRIRVAWVAQAHVTPLLALAMREWTLEDAEKAAMKIEERKLGRS